MTLNTDMPIGISSGTIRNKKGTLIVEDKIKKIVQTYGNLYFLTENGVLSGVGLNNSVQIGGSNIALAYANYLKIFDSTGTRVTATLNMSGNYVGVWGLRFGYTAGILETPNLDYVYSNTVLGSSNMLDFDAGYTYTTDVKYKSSLFKNFSFSVRKNGELWGWGYNDNLELGITSDIGYKLLLPDYGPTPNAWEYGGSDYPITRWRLNNLHKSLQDKTVFNPKKLNIYTNWTSVVANNIGEYYKHILLNSNGEIYTFGGDLNAPVKIGSNSDWKYISYDYAINNNDELYRLRDVQYPITYDTNAFIGGGQSLGNGNFTTNNPLTVLNYGEKIKKVVASNTSKDVIFLSETGKLSGIGINNLSLLGGIPINQYKLLAIPNITDNIKDIVISRNSAYAYTSDNSLLVWGTNLNSRLGTGSTAATVTTPTKILTGLVSEVVPLSSYTLVLGTNGTVSAAGKNETYGILGTNDTISKTSFARISGVSGVKQLVGNNTRNYALGTNGLLSGWGMGGGLLGDPPNITITPASLSIQPTGIAIDSIGNLYFGQKSNILKRNIDGSFTTFKSGFTNVEGIRIDTNDDVYVVDRTNASDYSSRIKKVTPAGVESIIGSPVSVAQLKFPYGFCIHNVNTPMVGNTQGLFIADEYGIRGISKNGNYAVSFGTTNSCNDGNARTNASTVAGFTFPSDVCSDGTYLYVADTYCNKIRKINSTTDPFVVTTIATGLNKPFGITLNGSTLYFTDKDNHMIKSVSINGGAITTIAGSTTSGFINGIGASAKFKNPTYIEYKNGFLYVSDTGNYAIRKINISTKEVTTIIGSGSYGTNITELTTYSYPNRLSAVHIPYVSNVNKIFVSGLGNSVFTLGTNKEVSAWGSNEIGQLGINTTSNAFSAIRLPLSNIKDIKISYQITNNDVYANPTVFFLSETGGLSGCGFNGSGQLANNTKTNSLSITKIDVPPVKKLYTDAHGAIYAVGTNDELSGWGNTTSYPFIPKILTDPGTLSAYKYTNVGPVDYLIVNDSLYKGVNNGAIAVGLNKRLTAWGINPLVDNDSLVIGRNNPTEITNVTDVSSVFVNPISANNLFINGTFVTFLTTYNYTGLLKIGSNEWKIVDKHGDYAIKLDNTLWSISGTPYQVDSNTDYENVFYGTPVRTTDPYDIKILTKKYFTETDTDTINALTADKLERSIINLKNYDSVTGFIGISSNTLHGSVTNLEGRIFNSTNYKLTLPSVVKY